MTKQNIFWRFFFFGIGAAFSTVLFYILSVPVDVSSITNTVEVNALSEIVETVGCSEELEKVPEVEKRKDIQFSKSNFDDNRAQCFNNAIQFIDHEWSQKYESQMRCIAENYKETWYEDEEIVQFFQRSMNGVYFKDDGMSWGLVHNMCFDSKENRVYLNEDEHSENELHILQKFLIGSSVSLLPSSLHQQLVASSSSQSPGIPWIASPNPSLDTPESWLSMFAWLLNHALYPESLPPIHEVYILSLTSPTLTPSHSFMLNFVSSFHQFLPPLHVTTHSSLPSSTLCWTDVGLVGEFRYIGQGGVFVSLPDAYLCKAAMYKHLSINAFNILRSTGGVAHAFIIKQYNGEFKRKIEDMEPINNAAHRMRSKVIVIPGTLSSISAESIRTLSKIDILISIPCPLLSLAMFMLPQSTIIELFPPHYRDSFYQRLSVASGLYYISHHNFSTPLPKECPDSDAVNDQTNFPSCYQIIHSGDSYVPVHTMRMYFLDAAEQSSHAKNCINH